MTATPIAHQQEAAEPQIDNAEVGSYHVVRNADTMEGVALQYDMRVQTLMRLNTMRRGDNIVPGQRLVITADAPPTSPPPKPSSLPPPPPLRVSPPVIDTPVSPSPPASPTANASELGRSPPPRTVDPASRQGDESEEVPSAYEGVVDLGALCLHMPKTVREHDWRLLYSSERHGTSMKTLLRRCGVTTEPCLTIIQDSKGRVFGCMSSHAWALGKSNGRHCYGNGQSFLFAFRQDGRLDTYPATGGNHLYQHTTDKFMAIGSGGGGYGLWVKDGMLSGASHCCDTYSNECLASSELFDIHSIEVWGLGWKQLKFDQPALLQSIYQSNGSMNKNTTWHPHGR